MDQRSVFLIVVPTCGNAPHGLWGLVPSSVGQLRLKTAAEMLRRDANSYLAICGGKRASFTKGEAVAAAHWFRQQYPELANRIAIISAKSKYTAGDMVALAEDIAQFQELYPCLEVASIFLVTHPSHAKLAGMSLLKGFWKILRKMPKVTSMDSGEPALYTPRTQAILNWITKHDPAWEKFWSFPLRVLANYRVRNE